MSHAARGGQTLLLKSIKARVFIVKCVFRVIWGFTRSTVSKNMTITLIISNFKCKNLPAPQGTTSTDRVWTKILLSAIETGPGEYFTDTKSILKHPGNYRFILRICKYLYAMSSIRNRSSFFNLVDFICSVNLALLHLLMGRQLSSFSEEEKRLQKSIKVLLWRLGHCTTLHQLEMKLINIYFFLQKSDFISNTGYLQKINWLFHLLFYRNEKETSLSLREGLYIGKLAERARHK